MAKTNIWQPSIEAIGIEQLINNGLSMTGELPEEGAIPVGFTKERHIYEIAHPEDGGGSPTSGGGLFDLDEWFRVDGRHIYVDAVHVINAGGSDNWEMFVTSGLNDGSATNLDDPVNDVIVASGSGSDRVDLGIQLLPRQRIRVTTGAIVATPPLRVILLVSQMSSEMGIR